MRDAVTFDWVEQQTGERYSHLCNLYGHFWQRTGPAEDVRGHPAAMHECERCGRRSFHWFSEPRLVE